MKATWNILILLLCSHTCQSFVIHLHYTIFHTLQNCLFFQLDFILFYCHCTLFKSANKFILLGGHNGTYYFSITPIIKDYCVFPYFQIPWSIFFSTRRAKQATTCMDFYHAILSTASGRSNCKESNGIWFYLKYF